MGVFGRDFAANTDLTVELRSTPVTLGTVATDAAGAFSTTVTIPATTDPGAHRIVVTAATGATAEIVFEVLAADTAPAALANTGVNSLVPLAGGALALVVAGAALLLIRRRKRA